MWISVLLHGCWTSLSILTLQSFLLYIIQVLCRIHIYYMKLALKFYYHSIHACFIKLGSRSKNFGICPSYLNRRLRLMCNISVQYLYVVISLTMYDTCHRISTWTQHIFFIGILIWALDSEGESMINGIVCFHKIIFTILHFLIIFHDQMLGVSN